MNHWETHKEEVERLLMDAVVARLALCDEDQPYIVPVNFGFREGCIYFHSGNKGTKVEILAKNPKVAFEMDAGVEVVRKEEPCKWSMKYRSLVGRGTASLITDDDYKKRALDTIMAHHAPGETFVYDERMLKATNVYEIKVESLRYRESDGS